MPDVEGVKRETLVDPEAQRAVHVLGDAFLCGFWMSREAMEKPPFTPPWEEFRERLHQTTDYDLLSPQRTDEIDREVGIMISAVESRAQLQREFIQRPDDVKEEIASLFRDISEGRCRATPKAMDIEWGLFSLAVVLKGSLFDSLFKAFERHGLTSPGDISGFADIVFRDKYRLIVHKKEARSSLQRDIIHEDCHVLERLRKRRYPFDFPSWMRNPRLNDLLDGGEPRASDWDFCTNLIDGLIALGVGEVRGGIGANLWADRPLSESLHEIDNIGSLLMVGFSAADNILYHPESIVEPSRRLNQSFRLKLKFYQARYQAKLFITYANQSVRSHGRDIPAKHWVASRITALPVDVSLEEWQRVLLGEEAQLEDIPWLDYISPFTQALIAFASRTADPEIFRRSSRKLVLLRERVGNYVDILAQEVINQKEGEIAREFGMDEEDYLALRKLVVKEAIGYIPKGKRKVARRELNQRLGLR